MKNALIDCSNFKKITEGSYRRQKPKKLEIAWEFYNRLARGNK